MPPSGSSAVGESVGLSVGLIEGTFDGDTEGDSDGGGVGGGGSNIPGISTSANWSRVSSYFLVAEKVTL